MKPKVIARWIAALSYVVVGVLHFIHEGFFIRIMPPGLPSPALLVAISGFAEILGGGGLLWPPTRRLASYGIVMLLIAVYPANIYMALHPELFADLGPPLALYLRLPMQFVFAAWAIWVGGDDHAPDDQTDDNQTDDDQTDDDQTDDDQTDDEQRDDEQSGAHAPEDDNDDLQVKGDAAAGNPAKTALEPGA